MASATQGIADSSEEPSEEQPLQLSEEFQYERFYDGHPVPPELGRLEEEEDEREEWLAGPAATEQREASWTAYEGISAPESEELLRSTFAVQLEALNSDPARFLSDAQLIRPLDETAATVKEGGESSLLASDIPVRTENEEGDLAKVDLSLESTPEGYETTNAISDLSLPTSAEEATEVGDEGFSIAQASAEDSPAQPFGDKNLFYPNVLPDTDLLVAPTASGVELFDQLRSKTSPEELRFELELPAGSELRADGSGGAEVVRQGETLTRIVAPIAIDAQGSEVPLEMTIEQGAIRLHIAHRDGDFAYPILADPIVEDWANASWYWGYNAQALTNGAWVWKTANSNIVSDVCCWAGKYIGLLINMRAAFYGPEQFGQWSYSTPNQSSYIKEAWITPFYREDYSCKAAQPHDYAGILMEPGQTWNPVISNKALSGTVSMKGKGQAFIIGEGSGPPGVWSACDRVVYAGGVALWLDDDNYPSISSVSGIPSGWVTDSTQFTIVAKAQDPGLGVRRVTITPHDALPIQDQVGNCTGLYGNRCPTTRNSEFKLSGLSFEQGKQSAGITVEDALGKTSSTYKFETMVDRTPPEIALSGQLAAVTDQEVGFGEASPLQSEGDDKLSLSVYNLKIEAKDGSNATPEKKRSGVKNIEIFLDAKETPEPVPWKAQECPGSSCEMKQTYTLKLDGLSSGVHKLKVIAVDFVGKKYQREIEFEYFPATGMKDEYVLHRFPLPDGQGNEAEEERPDRPELAVNVMNGNLVYRQKDVEVTGPGASLEVERYYNSMLPSAENSEWGDGWSLAQTPRFEFTDTGGSPAPDEATLLSDTGGIQDEIDLPTEEGIGQFVPELRATITKQGTGYLLSDESGESSPEMAFNENGQTEEVSGGGDAKVNYSYAGGALEEIAVKDPAGASRMTEGTEVFDPIPTYRTFFGSSGSGSGKLNEPGDVAITSEGRLWVADKNNDRIQKFNSKGEYLGKFGTTGAGKGQFNHPTAVAIDAKGNIWVVDANNHRIQQFNEKGEFIKAVGSKGTGSAQFTYPEGIAIDSKGNIWVSDTNNGRLQKFNEKGEFIKVVSSKGSGKGQLGEPTGVAIGPGNKVWVADWQNNRVSVFDESGGFVQQFGSHGGGNGQFRCPDAIDVDSAGNVWVSDTFNGRVQGFNQSGEYIGQFGAEGAGEGEFAFDAPTGITADGKGNLWIADPGNHRIQRWTVEGYSPVYRTSFGISGSGDGQMNSPGDVAIDADGNLWVADKDNNRIEKFNADREFLGAFGKSGSATGQFNHPTALAFDLKGNLWVVDANNHRIQQFNEKGEFIKAVGSKGTGSAQFTYPEGIAIDSKGNIWVSDTNNGRLQKFNEKGEFIKVVSSKGSGTEQLGEPTGVAIGPGNKVWVADWQNNRISVFNESGGFVQKFGSNGGGNGQFRCPDAIEVDSQGTVWVSDTFNDRVQAFNQNGEYLAQFGSEGSSFGQFSLEAPTGIATDGKGNLWVTDPNNDRIQKWQEGSYEPVAEEEDDPAVALDVSNGLVTDLEGEEAGEQSYSYSGDDLVSHSGLQGETKYEYDASGRITKVVLPNGTTGSVAYESYGRVKSVTVDPAGAVPAKTTTFLYSTEPRRTEVTPEKEPVITYEIGADGSVLKWWNTVKPPEFKDLAGSLYANKETANPITAGDHNLLIEGHSEEGIASIQTIANNNQLVHETTCKQDLEKLGTECKDVVSNWVTNTNNHPPGILYLEVIVTDELGQSESRRFWVNIPLPPPPPAPGAPVPPTYQEILDLREEYGLDIVDPVENELDRDHRIFNLLNAWFSGDPVARATKDRWGVPLRTRDVEELEYRLRYQEQAAWYIPAWAATNAGSTYAGYYTDESKGGLIYAGFKGDQASQVTALRNSASLLAPARVVAFPSPPQHALSELENLESQVESLAESQGLSLTKIGIDVKANSVSLGTPNVGQVSEAITVAMGPNQPIDVIFDPQKVVPRSGRERISGQIHAGDRFTGDEHPLAFFCSAGFGAFDAYKKPSNNEQILRYFMLSAGHCATLGERVRRRNHSGEGNKTVPFGVTQRRGWDQSKNTFDTDISAIRLESRGLTPRQIYTGDGFTIPVRAAIVPRVGMIVCQSGVTSNDVRCGKIKHLAQRIEYDGQKMLQVEYDVVVLGGDSGGPVWQKGTGNAVGIVTAGHEDDETEEEVAPGYFTPLLPIPGRPHMPGAFEDPGLAPLRLMVAD